MKSNYSIIANFFINDKETLQRMRDSAFSFKDAKYKIWIINIRGAYKEEASHFLKKLIPTKCKISFHDFQDWQKETKLIINEVSTDFILFWVEDHILQTECNVLDEVIFEMEKRESDFLLYTFFCFGYHKKVYDSLDSHTLKNDRYISTFKLSISEYFKIMELRDIHPYLNQYVTALPSIFSKKFFMKLLNNRHYNFKNIETPHFIEKPIFSIRYMPFKMSYLKNELFASIDDDRGIEGYSLISRKLYPARVSVKFSSIDHDRHYNISFIENLWIPEKIKYMLYIIKNIFY